jgi:hypothetical protein
VDIEQLKLRRRVRLWVVGDSSEALPYSSSTDMQPQQMPLGVYQMIGGDVSPGLKEQTAQSERTFCSLGLKKCCKPVITTCDQTDLHSVFPSDVTSLTGCPK